MNEHQALRRIEWKIDMIMRIQGVTNDEIAQLVAVEGDESQLQTLINKLKTSSDALKTATQANK